VSRRIFLTPKQQVKHCEDKGIQFNKISKSKAISYLEDNNNYFKLRSFRKNYIKDPHLKKYTNLDFSDLVDLAIIDNRLRRILLEMALSIEHFSKVHLLKILQETGEDGYTVIQNYINQLSKSNKKRLISDLKKNKSSTYCGNLHKKYMENNIFDCPVWVFIEVISFGQYLHFYEFCAKQCSHPSNQNELNFRLYLMRTVKDLRNACAHNNCIINDLRAPLPHTFKPNLQVTDALANIGISKAVRRKHLNRVVFYQILVTFYAHINIVSSPGVHNHIAYELQEFKSRLFRDNDYSRNDIINSTFKLFIKLIDNWYNLV
jgi:abortive infection bacteriophage resistance protein